MARSRKQATAADPRDIEALPPCPWDNSQLDAVLGERTSLEEVDAVVRQMEKLP